MAKAKEKERRVEKWPWLEMGPFIAWSHQARLTNSLMLALRRDHLQSILEAFGKL